MREEELQETQMIEVAEDPKPDPVKKTGKKKKKLSKTGLLVFRILFVVCLCVAAYSGFRLYIGLREYRRSQESYSELIETVQVSETTEEQENRVRVNFDRLREINPDITAWLYIPDTTVDYPVVQGADNSYYLTHLFSKEENHAGCVFMDYENNADLADKNTILYAHNMLNGSMFAELLKYREQAYYDAHPVIYLTMADGTEYEVLPFADLNGNAWSGYGQIDFESEDAFMSFVEELRSGSSFNSDVQLTPSDQIITFSTCRYEVSNGRYALFGKLVKVN